jgi:hypothetical protein
MNAEVVDTNVLLVANGQHPDISPECVISCAKRLERLKRDKIFVVDDGYEIVREYQNKTQPRTGKGPGDAFLKWALQNLGNPSRCHRVTLNETHPSMYAQFPDPVLQPHFDPPDRKFAAVANAHPDKPPILQAADCKWLNWKSPLAAAGISVDFVCPEDVCRFYRHKFPGKPVPAP